jgi:hypothetical protein
VVENSVETLYARDGNIALLGELQRRSEVSLNFHWTFRLKVEPHSAIVLLRLYHSLKGCFPEVSRKYALLRFREREQFVQNASNQGADADLLDKLGVIWCLKEDTSGMESNRPAMR